MCHGKNCLHLAEVTLSPALEDLLLKGYYRGAIGTIGLMFRSHIPQYSQPNKNLGYRMLCTLWVDFPRKESSAKRIPLTHNRVVQATHTVYCHSNPVNVADPSRFQSLDFDH